jgi:pentatricopeptide repeat protein
LWASLINAWASRGDAGRAVGVFESSHFSTALPDGLIYEALFNALFACGRIDLVPTLRERMKLDGVHPTAYVSNALIRGYSEAGHIEQAREIFENMRDAPLGVAASTNHLAHQPTIDIVSADAPVYREVRDRL